MYKSPHIACVFASWENGVLGCLAVWLVWLQLVELTALLQANGENARRRSLGVTIFPSSELFCKSWVWSWMMKHGFTMWNQVKRLYLLPCKLEPFCNIYVRRYMSRSGSATWDHGDVCCSRKAFGQWWFAIEREAWCWVVWIPPHIPQPASYYHSLHGWQLGLIDTPGFLYELHDRFE